MAFELIHFESDSELARHVAAHWLKILATRADKSRPFGVALSGGRITQQFFESVARRAGEQGTSFENVHFFWADERCVPPDDPESNFKVADALLFVPLRIASENIHRIRGEEEPARAATAAEGELQAICPANRHTSQSAPNPASQPVLDLVFLGMGEDGHVASLFPGEPEAVAKSSAVYRPVRASKPPPQRITIGYAAIAAAREVWVLVSGAGKEAPLRASLQPAGTTPLARVLQSRSKTLLFTTAPAKLQVG